MSRVRRSGTLALLALFVAASGSAAPHTPAPLTVFAAASLAQAFEDAGADFTRIHGVPVRFNFAGSQQLVAQLGQGARADVFASADERSMAGARKRGLVAARPVVFATNRLAVIVPRANPGRIDSLADLARPGVRLVAGGASVPVGVYARTVIRRVARSGACGADFESRTLANIVSHEDDVRGVIGKVQLGEADAGLCYRSDVTPSVRRRVRMVAIPDSLNALAAYPIAVVRGSARAADAARFVAHLRSSRGRAILLRHGFTLPPATP